MGAAHAGLRLAFVALLAVVLGWAWTVVPAQRSVEKLAFAAQRLVAGETYQPAVLAEFQRQIAPVLESGACDPALLQDALLIEGALADVAGKGRDLPRLDESVARVDTASRRLLACSPLNGFAWLTLFWSTNHRQGFGPSSLPLLEASFATAPREGWISIRRAGLAMGLFRFLSAPLQSDVLDEAAALVRSGVFLGPGISVLVGPGWNQRFAILDRLANLDSLTATEFDRRQRRLGVGLPIPNSRLRRDRPWL